jgi:hypothetical protein
VRENGRKAGRRSLLIVDERERKGGKHSAGREDCMSDVWGQEERRYGDVCSMEE